MNGVGKICPKTKQSSQSDEEGNHNDSQPNTYDANSPLWSRVHREMYVKAPMQETIERWTETTTAFTEYYWLFYWNNTISTGFKNDLEDLANKERSKPAPTAGQKLV